MAASGGEGERLRLGSVLLWISSRISVLRRHVLSHGLRAQERARRVHIYRFPPVGFRHIEGRHAAYDPGETEQVVDGGEGGDCVAHCVGDGRGVGDVDGDAEDAGGRERACEGCDGALGGAQGRLEVPDAEA